MFSDIKSLKLQMLGIFSWLQIQFVQIKQPNQWHLISVQYKVTLMFDKGNRKLQLFSWTAVWNSEYKANYYNFTKG